MITQFHSSLEDGVRIVGASNGDTDYILGQVGDDDPSMIHFEYGDQVNSGYNLVVECSIDMDGCHVVLNDGALIHFYWNPPRHQELSGFIDSLREIYASNLSVLDVRDVSS